MNWVGGARNRVKFQNERKAQKEFFERKKLGVQHAGSRLKSMSTPHLKKHSVSQDLLALQTISHAHSNTKSDLIKRPVRKLDLEGFRSTVTGRKYKEVELPTSPYETPSMLNLMEKDLHTSKHTRSKSDCLMNQNDKVSQSQLGFNSRTKFSSLLSPKRNTEIQSSVSSLLKPSFKNTCTIIPEKRHFTPQKDCAKNQASNNNFGLNPFMCENCDITGNTSTSRFIAACYTRSDLKPKPNRKTYRDEENNPYICHSKHDNKLNKLQDERMHNLWVSEDFQISPMIKYKGDEFQDDQFKHSYPTYKPVDSKTLNNDYMSSQFHKSYDEKEVICDHSEGIQLRDKNIYIRHNDIDLPMDEPDIYQHPHHNRFQIENCDFSVKRGNDKNNIFLNELTPFFRTPNHDFHNEKQKRKMACRPTPELDNSKHFEKMNQFGMHNTPRNLENEFSYSDSEYVWKKRKYLKNTIEVGKINVCKNPIQNLHDVNKSESFETMLQPFKVGQSESLWNLSELRVPETYFDKNREVKNDIVLKQPDKLQETKCAEDISSPIKYSSLSTTKSCKKSLPEGTTEAINDESDDGHCVAICTKEEYEQHWRSKCSPIDEILNELIQLDNQDENVKNTSFSYNKHAIGAPNSGSAKKNTLSEIDQTGSQKDILNDKECVAEVIETLVSKVVIQESTLELSNTILPKCAWTKPEQSKKSLENITSVFRENKIMEQNPNSNGKKLNDNSVELSGLSSEKSLHETGKSVQSRILQYHSTDQKLNNNNSDDSDFSTLLKPHSGKLHSSPVMTFVETNKHKFVDASTSPIPPTLVDVSIQWETPESSQEVFVSADTQHDDDIDVVMDEDSAVQSCCMSMELSCEHWIVQDNGLDSQSQRKEQAYTLRSRKK